MKDNFHILLNSESKASPYGQALCNCIKSHNENRIYIFHCETEEILLLKDEL